MTLNFLSHVLDSRLIVIKYCSVNSGQRSLTHTPPVSDVARVALHNKHCNSTTHLDFSRKNSARLWILRVY